MSRASYEYRYTVTGWYTEAALAQGFIEEASSGNKRVTIKATLKGRNQVNMYLIRLSENDKELYFETCKNLSRARKMFTRLCQIHKLNHPKFNPQ